VADDEETPRRRRRRTQDDDPEHAARRAAQYVADFTGRHPENVISVERHDGAWQVGVEVVETHRIPDTTDVLAIYDVHLDGAGELLSYRRMRRYARGQLDKEGR
jgi:hypothetical protein